MDRAQVPFGEIKIGLIIVLIIYLVSYIWKWYADNPQIFAKLRNEKYILNDKLDGIFENWVKHLAPNFTAKTLDSHEIGAHKEDLDIMFSEVKNLYTTIKAEYEYPVGWGWA